MAAKGKLTPLMRQYWEIKSQHTDKILLFRMGDFFEMFHEDAEIAAPILNIALTSRNKKAKDETKMCGMPHHSVATPISKLLSAGHKVAICDQVEDPKEAKGLVKRAVTRILSPGMVYDPDTLDELSANYICSFDQDVIAFFDSSTGAAFYYKNTSKEQGQRLMFSLSPAELVVSAKQKEQLLKISDFSLPHLTVFEDIGGREEGQSLPKACLRLLAYSSYMQGESAQKTNIKFELRHLQKTMALLPSVVRHLELFETYKGEKTGSLFMALKRTKTSAGARLLKNWMQFPLTDAELIKERHDEVDSWYSKPSELKELRKVLSGLGDIERRLSKINSAQCKPQDLISLCDSLRAGLAVSPFCMPGKIETSVLRSTSELVQKVERTLVAEPPMKLNQGGFIASGVNTHLDELIRLNEDSKSLLVEMESEEKQKTGIPSLKIRYNNVFGFFIEVRNTHKDKVPSYYTRKQTLANAERYLTQELKILEDKILSSKTKRVEVELQIFTELKNEIISRTPELLFLSRVWSELDVLSSLAWLAQEQNYKRPSFSNERRLELKASRHPVVEQEVMKPFVPNDLIMPESSCVLLTGPNMAGKSTMMRQVAVISIMAQMGSFVPAESAVLPLFSQVFTRIGASDFLTEGLSTFMVEMKETAELLDKADETSLVILDEIGRGTSTFDGMSLAQAILEHLISETKSLSLFATHYHELTVMENKYPQILNHHMSIVEKSGDIQFLYTLAAGPANKSYGVQVACLAGLPSKVTRRARSLLNNLESGASTSQLSLVELPLQEETSYPDEDNGVVKELKQLSVQSMTPIDALNQIAKWQKELS